MSAIPLSGNAFGSADGLGAFETPWTPPGVDLPPVPGSAPARQARAPAAPQQLEAHGPPVMGHPAAPAYPAPPTAVEPSQSWAGPVSVYAGYGDPSPQAMPQPAFAQAVEENAHTLGLALILTGLGTAVGIKLLGGLYGAASGGLYGGSLVNLIRAARAVTVGTPDADHEAVVSATYGVVGAGVASYILYQGRKEKRAQ